MGKLTLAPPPDLPLSLAETDLQASDKQAATNGIVEAIEICLRQIFDQKIQAVGSQDAHYADLLVQIKQLVSRGGKRLRPQLVVQAYEAFGGNNREAIIKIAASQELFHAFILMHDDIIDRDTVRWGGPNISGHYAKRFSTLLPDDKARHDADSFALVAGDICFNLSNEVLLDSDFPPSRLLKASQLVQQTLFTMIGGELLDVALPIYHSINAPIEDEQLLHLCETKTASYSFCTPLRLGALLAGADAAQDQMLNDFGRLIGIAFQLRDDMLGIFGDERRLGKSTLTDIQEGKRTLLMEYALRAATNKQRDELQRILGNHEASLHNLKTVQTTLRQTGALSKTEALVQAYCQRAALILEAADLPLTLRSYLVDLSVFCAQRNY